MTGEDARDVLEMLRGLEKAVVDLDPVKHDSYEDQNQIVMVKDTRVARYTGTPGALGRQVMKSARVGDAEGKANGMKFNLETVIVQSPSEGKSDKNGSPYRLFRGGDTKGKVGWFKVWGDQATANEFYEVGVNLQMAQVVLNTKDKRFDVRQSSKIVKLTKREKPASKLEYIKF